MKSVFISFRQKDNTRDMAWRLVDYIRSEGLYAFYDMDMLSAGDFRESIRKAMESAVVVIVIVGQNWLEEASADGLISPSYWVQVEIETAFAAGIPILPILVHESSMPRAECLPEKIREFVFQQAVSVRSDAHFADDMKRVCTMLEQLAPTQWSTSWWKRIILRLFQKS